MERVRLTMDSDDERIAQRLSPSRLSLLLRVSGALASSLDLSEVLQIAIESAVDVLGFDTGAIYSLEGQALHVGAMTPPLGPDVPDELRHAYLGDHPHIESAVGSGDIVVLHDALEAELSASEAVVAEVRGLRSVLYAPLMLEGEAIGAFIVGTTGDVHEFTTEEMDLCRVLSSQITLAVANARLYESVACANAEVTRTNENLETLVDERTAELVESNEARARFLRALGHEFRTPLNIIVGATDRMLHGLSGDLGPDAMVQLELINRVGNHLLAISDDVLDLSRIDAGVMHVVNAPVDMACIVSECLGAIADDAANKGLQLAHSAPDGMPKLVSDKVRVRQILLNLMTNAVKYTPAGSVTIRCWHPDDGHLAITVKDTGPGIPAERLSTIFQEFSHDYETSGHAEGLGLGLAISRRLAHLLGGELTVETEVGKGSEFSLILPTGDE